MQKRRLIFTTLFLSVSMLGCQLKHVLIDFSGIEKINSVEMLQHVPNDPAMVLTDESVVNKWKSYLSKINHSWEKPWDTFPTPKATLLLKENGTYKFAIYIGSNYAWVGVRKEEQSPVLHNLSTEESSELKDLVKEFKTVKSKESLEEDL